MKKKAASIAYNGDDKQNLRLDHPNFAINGAGTKIPTSIQSELVVEARFDGNSKLIALPLMDLKLLMQLRMVWKDREDGSSGLPWLTPNKTLSLDNLTHAISEVIRDSSDDVTVTPGIAAVAAGLSLLAFSGVALVILAAVLFFLAIVGFCLESPNATLVYVVQSLEFILKIVCWKLY
ncbi:hypothetical protein V8G54_028684 [Vigna mungo]|uniref:Uncharacterized protein n=1 Tax=Vigna mungo TaxID=3915 RepID=A0AAQ3MT82_VIGMU